MRLHRSHTTASELIDALRNLDAAITENADASLHLEWVADRPGATEQEIKEAKARDQKAWETLRWWESVVCCRINPKGLIKALGG